MIAVRAERPGDEDAIEDVISAAFATAAHSGGTEAQIVERLRADDVLSVALVAEDRGAIVGHVAFSPVMIGDGSTGWFGLGPVAVTPERQGEGIGSSLIRAGLVQLRDSGAAGCVVLGNPAYYRRFGFRVEPGLHYPAAPAPYFQGLAFGGSLPHGEVRYHPAFG